MSVALGLLLALQSVQPTGKEDFRDVVERRGGPPVRGRVVTPYAEDRILILQGGKRVRVDRADVESMTTVNDRLRQFFERHEKVGEVGADRQWGLAAWAEANELPAMARLMAYQVLLVDAEHEGANEFLGHKRSPKGWLWRRDERFFSREAFDEQIGEWGRALEIDSEHWTLRTDAGVRRAIDTLLDLERLYLHVHDRFGPALDLYETLQPMQVFAWKDADAFPGYTELRIPYYAPPAGGRTGEGVYTFFEEGSGRAKGLFCAGTEILLNRCLAVDATYGDTENRLVPWFEIGFGQWIESQLEGEAGRARPVPSSIDRADARLVLERRPYRLPNILSCDVGDNYYDTLTDTKDVDWAYAHLFVAYLMEGEGEGGTAQGLFRYAHLAMRKKMGASSTAFDMAMGRKIETFEKPFEAWLRARAQPDALPK